MWSAEVGLSPSAKHATRGRERERERQSKGFPQLAADKEGEGRAEEGQNWEGDPTN